MFKLRTLCVTSVALMLAMVLCASPVLAGGSFTASEGMGAVTFRGTGAAAYYYNVTVEHPYAVGLDADYWNMTVYADPWDGGVATNTTYFVHVHINDGATNITKNVTLACKNDMRIYSNVSFEAADWASLVENTSGLIYIELLGATGALPKAAWAGSLQIWETDITAGLMNVMILVLPLLIMLVFLGAIMKALDPVRKHRK